MSTIEFRLLFLLFVFINIKEIGKLTRYAFPHYKVY